MRHAAREPPSPIFVIRRLLQLLAVWRVQVVGGGCAVNASFAEGVVFLQVSACSGSLLRQELGENCARKCSRKSPKMKPKYIRIS